MPKINPISAKEARILSEGEVVREDFLSKAYDRIRQEAKKGYKYAVLQYCSDLIGNVYKFYKENPSEEDDEVSSNFENEVLSSLGLALVKELRSMGYKVRVSLFYEDRQLVNAKLEFTISW